MKIGYIIAIASAVVVAGGAVAGFLAYNMNKDKNGNDTSSSSQNSVDEYDDSDRTTHPVKLSADAQLTMLSYTYSNSMNMEDTYTYTVTNAGDKYTLKIESPIYKDDEYYETEISSEEYSKVAELAKNCKIENWNGFHGVNTMVLDGDGFSLSAEYSDGASISASGSNSYPDGFGSFSKVMDDMFNPYRKQYNYDRIPKKIESDDISSVYVNFKDNGSSGYSSFKFELRKEVLYDRNNINVQVFDYKGEFMESMQRKDDEYQVYGKKDGLDLSEIQKVIRKYDIPSINGYDKSAKDYSNSEWFQISVYYDSDESIEIYGTEKFDSYDDFRKDLLSACVNVVNENKDILTKY